MAQFVGRAVITADGAKLDMMKGAKLSLGGIKRNPVVTMSRVGYSEELVHAELEGEIPVAADTDLETIRNMVGATVLFYTDNGHKYLVKNAFNQDPSTITTGEGGKVPVKLGGDPAEKI